MSELLQSGQHPDADQLSAFMEHALPAHEQEETLAHLAICPHCRSIVALSMPPVDPVSQPHPEPARRRWPAGWMIVWPAGAALAALILAGVYMRNGLVIQRDVPPTQTAQSRPARTAQTVAADADAQAASARKCRTASGASSRNHFAGRRQADGCPWRRWK